MKLYEQRTRDDGVIRLEEWEEGYALWYHGQIVWKSNWPDLEHMHDTLQRVARLLPRYRMKGETAGDDEALDAVLESVLEAINAPEA